MKRFLILLALAGSMFSTAVLADQAVKMVAMAHFVNADGDMIGEAKMWQGPKGVVVLVEISGLEPGKHAIHIHSVGTCEPDFKASKGHINILGASHGLLNPDGPDNGDLPNIYVNSDGSAMAEMYTTAVHFGGMMDNPPDTSANLMDEDGSALVVHAQGDDHITQPIGGAGGRVACGVITGMM
ncbi:MAG: superoxide dismutase family protein [Acidiferrobacterales bacterium]|nr:superoxide dismutase family protein [Acidiferrobacterales bacterium]